MKQFAKLSLGGATIGARMTRKNWKSEKMDAKFVRTTSTIYKQGEKKFLPQPFTPCIVDVHSYKNISLARYRVAQ